MRKLTIRVHLIARLMRDRISERGASLVEYAMLVAFVALACYGALGFMGAENDTSVDRSADSIVQAN